MEAWTMTVACGTALAVRKRVAAGALDESLIEGVTRGAIAYANTLGGMDYLNAVNEIHAFGRRMAAEFLRYDVLVSTTLAAPPCKTEHLKPDSEDFVAYRTGKNGCFAYSPFAAAFNASGQPAISLPLHWTQDMLPVGVHLAMPMGEDAELMALASQLEQADNWSQQQNLLLRSGGIWPR